MLNNFRKPSARQDFTTLGLPGEAIARLGRGRVNDTAVSPDGTVLAIASHIGVWVYTLGSRPAAMQLRNASEQMTAVAFSATGTWIAAGCADGRIKIWELASGACIAAYDGGGRVDSLAFSPDSTRLAATGGSPQTYHVDMWRIAPFEYEQRIHANPSGIACECAHTGPIAFSPDGKLLACTSPGKMAAAYAPGARRLPLTELISVWDVQTGSHQVSLAGLAGTAYSLCFSPCGTHLAAGDTRGVLMTWRVAGWEPALRSVTDTDARRWVAYSPDGTLRVADFSLQDGTLTVTAPERGNTLYQHGGDTTTYRPDFSTGKYLAFSCDQDMQVVSVEKPESRSVIPFHHATAPESLQFSADARTLYACQRHYGVFAWDLAAPERPPSVFRPRVDEGEGYLAMRVSPEADIFVISAGERSVRLWRSGDTTPLAVIKTAAEPGSAVVSPTANRLAHSDETGAIYVCDMQGADGSCIRSGDGTGNVQSISFSATGAYLLSQPDLLYDVNRRENVQGFPMQDIQFHAFSPCGMRVLGETQAALFLWDILRPEQFSSFAKPGGDDVGAVAFTSCGGYVAVSFERSRQLQIWDVRCGEMIAGLALSAEACSLAFSSDSGLLAGGLSDGTLLLWDMTPYL